MPPVAAKAPPATIMLAELRENDCIKVQYFLISSLKCYPVLKL